MPLRHGHWANFVSLLSDLLLMLMEVYPQKNHLHHYHHHFLGKKYLRLKKYAVFEEIDVEYHQMLNCYHFLFCQNCHSVMMSWWMGVVWLDVLWQWCHLDQSIPVPHLQYKNLTYQLIHPITITKFINLNNLLGYLYKIVLWIIRLNLVNTLLMK